MRTAQVAALELEVGEGWWRGVSAVETALGEGRVVGMMWEPQGLELKLVEGLGRQRQRLVVALVVWRAIGVRTRRGRGEAGRWPGGGDL